MATNEIAAVPHYHRPKRVRNINANKRNSAITTDTSEKDFIMQSKEKRKSKRS